MSPPFYSLLKLFIQTHPKIQISTHLKVLNPDLRSMNTSKSPRKVRLRSTATQFTFAEICYNSVHFCSCGNRDGESCWNPFSRATRVGKSENQEKESEKTCTCAYSDGWLQIPVRFRATWFQRSCFSCNRKVAASAFHFLGIARLCQWLVLGCIFVFFNEISLISGNGGPMYFGLQIEWIESSSLPKLFCSFPKYMSILSMRD